jgi:hypothetical protein
VTNDDSIMRQRAKDAEYVAACRAHGITPDAPSYFAPGIVVEAEAADNVGRTAGPKKNGGIIRTRADDPSRSRNSRPRPRRPAASSICSCR